MYFLIPLSYRAICLGTVFISLYFGFPDSHALASDEPHQENISIGTLGTPDTHQLENIVKEVEILTLSQPVNNTLIPEVFLPSPESLCLLMPLEGEKLLPCVESRVALKTAAQQMRQATVGVHHYDTQMAKLTATAQELFNYYTQNAPLMSYDTAVEMLRSVSQDLNGKPEHQPTWLALLNARIGQDNRSKLLPMVLYFANDNQEKALLVRSIDAPNSSMSAVYNVWLTTLVEYLEQNCPGW